MMQESKSNNNKGIKDQLKENFFNKAEIPYGRSKSEVWESLSQKIDQSKPVKKSFFTTERIMLSIAATLMILLSIGAFMRFYTVTVTVPSGEQITETLPDGSRVKLNAQSVLSYHPYWWNISRFVGFEGEGFFEVAEGEAFKVRSVKGITEVLGTSFNVYSRPDAYRVLCVTGKVKVSSKNDESVVLTPDYEASIIGYEPISMRKVTSSKQEIGWTEGMFNFTAIPLKVVFYEIERQFNVRIIYNASEDLEYTGFFSKDSEIEDVLKVVCKPFNLKYTKKAKQKFEISY